jgi:hypothetical protein
VTCSRTVSRRSSTSRSAHSPTVLPTSPVSR